jgi:PKD repeat protein
MSDNVNFGDGYDNLGDLPVEFNPNDGTISVGKTHKQITSSDGEGIADKDSLNLPLDGNDDSDYNPPVPKPAPPTAFFDYVGLSNRKIQFVNQTLGNFKSIAWDFGDGQKSSQFNPEHIYASSGNYEVRLTASNSGGFDVHTKYVEVLEPAPVVSFDFAVGGFTIYTTNNSTTQNWVWDFGDGTSSTDQNPNHVYTDVGTYIVTLTSGALTIQKTIKIDVEISLSWTDNSSNEDGFRIEHSLDGSTGWTTVNTVGAGITTYGVTLANDGIDSSVLNYFRVYAYNAGGDSANPTNTSSVVCS